MNRILFLPIGTFSVLISLLIAKSIDPFDGSIWAGWFWLIGLIGGIAAGVCFTLC